MTTITQPSRLRQHAWEIALLGAMLCAFAYLMKRNFGLSPAIFADEWYYSKFSRLQPLSESWLPSYLYLWVFRSTNACGEHFLDCARGLNTLWYVGAAPFIYLVARRLAGRPLAFAVAAMTLLAPLNLYTSFFMPEAMYYFAFAVLSWVALNFTHWPSARYALATGVLLGLMSLIKVHALFLLPALCLFTVFVRWNAPQRQGWLRDSVLAVGLTVLAMFAVRLGLGYVLAGEPGLQLFGSFYGSSARNTAQRSVLALLPPGFISGRAHLMTLAVLFALPMALLLHRLPLLPSHLRRDGATAPLRLFVLLMLGSAVAMTVAYTATLGSPGSLEGLRLHLRYYSFAFPLLLVLAAAVLHHPLERIRPRFAVVVAVLLGLAMLIALVKLPTYTINTIDGPDIAAVNLRPLFGLALVALNLLILVLWLRHKKLALQLYLFVAMPALFVVASSASALYLSQLKQPWAADLAGDFARRFVPTAEQKLITVAGTDLSALMRTQFHIDDKDTSLLELPDEHQPIERYQIPVHNKWLLVVGDHALPNGIRALVSTPEYKLVRLDTVRRTLGTTDLEKPIGDAMIERIDGVSHSESLGRWTTGKEVVLHFRKPLPLRFNLTLKGFAFGPNADAPFILHAGNEAIKFRVSTIQQEVNLRVESAMPLRTLSIEVPHPTAPKDVMPSVDERTIGMAIKEVSIGELDPVSPQPSKPGVDGG